MEDALVSHAQYLTQDFGYGYLHKNLLRKPRYGVNLSYVYRQNSILKYSRHDRLF